MECVEVKKATTDELLKENKAQFMDFVILKIFQAFVSILWQVQIRNWSSFTWIFLKLKKFGFMLKQLKFLNCQNWSKFFLKQVQSL